MIEYMKSIGLENITGMAPWKLVGSTRTITKSIHKADEMLDLHILIKT